MEVLVDCDGKFGLSPSHSPSVPLQGLNGSMQPGPSRPGTPLIPSEAAKGSIQPGVPPPNKS